VRQSVEEVRVGVADLFPQGLEAEPSSQWEGGLLSGIRRKLVGDELGRSRRFGQQLGLAGAFHGDEPPHRFVHRLTNGDVAVVLMDDGLVAAECIGDGLARVEFEGNRSPALGAQAVVLVEAAGILRDGVEQTTE
jgi:hypothetical protein